MSDVTLRRATKDDVEAAHALVVDLGYTGIDPADFARGYAAVLADPAQCVWLAERAGLVVGLMSLGTRPQIRLAGPITTIDELVVARHARGLGVGARLIALAKEEAAPAGARRLELHTARARPSYDRGFYMKNGFVEVDSAVMRWQVRPRDV